MGDLQTDKSQIVAITPVHASVAHPKPLQKLAPTVQVNKENSAPNSVQHVSSKSTTKGLQSRERHGLSVSHSTTTSVSAKKMSHGLSATHHVQTSDESVSKPQSANLKGTPGSGHRAVRGEVAGTREGSSQGGSSSAARGEELVAGQITLLFNHLSSNDKYKDDPLKWCDAFKQYCEKYDFGFDVLRGVLELIPTEKPEFLVTPGFVEMWRFWTSRLALEDQYEHLKMIKNNYAKTRKVAALYIAMASIKLKNGDFSEALRELEKGIAYSAEPIADLENMAESIRKSSQFQSNSSSASRISTSTNSNGHRTSASNGAGMTPSTPQQLVHMDCDNTPSAHLSASIQPKAATSATKVRSLSTPSSVASRTADPVTKSDAAFTPSPPSDSTGSLTSAGNPGSSAAAKRRSSTTLGARLGVRGGAQRIPKATSAVNPSSTMDVSEDRHDKHMLLPSIDEDSSAMKVDDNITDSPLMADTVDTKTLEGSTSLRQLAQAIPSRMSASNISTPQPRMSMTHGTISTPHNANSMVMSEAPLQANSETPAALQTPLQPLSANAAMSTRTRTPSISTPLNVAPNQSNQTNILQPASTSPLVASNVVTSSVPTRRSSSEHMVVDNLGSSGKNSQLSSAAATPVMSKLPWQSQSLASQSAVAPQQVVSQPVQAPVAVVPQKVPLSAMAAPVELSPVVQSVSQSMQQVMTMQPPTMPVSGVPSGPLSRTSATPQAPGVDLAAMIETAAATAKALGRELFMVRGRPYVNLCAIGKGGTCSVYKVMDMQGGIWALKVISWTNDTIEVVRGYNEEVRLLESVQKSPYVVKLMDYELIATSNTMYILFEFAETDLKRLFIPMKQDAAAAQVRPGGRFATDLDALRYYWRSMLSAVLVLHKHRIVHLDLKPANFVLVEGRVKIIDFGIAKKVLNDTMHAKVDDIAGTILYMAPESLKNTSGRNKPHKVGFPADVWSMGCILHQMVYGFTPFEHVSGLGPKIAAITAAEPIEIQPIDNEDLMDCLKLCLDKTAANRPTIEQLLNHPFLGGFITWA